MPKAAPIMKIQKCRNYGATVLVHVRTNTCKAISPVRNSYAISVWCAQGDNMQEAKRFAMLMSKKRELVYINGYDHPNIIAGQGTIGLEICEQVADADAVVIPVGGGGLIAGIATAIKELSPTTKIIVSGCSSSITYPICTRIFNCQFRLHFAGRWIGEVSQFYKGNELWGTHYRSHWTNSCRWFGCADGWLQCLRDDHSIAR